MVYYRCLMLCCVSFISIQCATTRGAGTERATIITAEIETAAQIVERSNISDTEKRRIVETLRAMKPKVERLGADVDHNKQIADHAQDAAKKWRLVKWLCIIAAGIASVFVARRFLPI